MAKIISPFVGSAKGKLGGAVYYTRTGGTFARQRVATVANPKTDEQLTTRVILSTASKAYRMFAPLANHAFQDMVGKAGNHQRFMKLNANMLRERPWGMVEGSYVTAFNSKGDDSVKPNPYIIAEGSLPSVPLEIGSLTPSPDDDPLDAGAIKVPVGTSALTYQAVCDALGVEAGTELTLVAVSSDTSNVAADEYTKCTFCRIILMPSSGEMTDSFLGAGNTINNPNPRNQGTENFLFSSAVAGGVATFVFTPDNITTDDVKLAGVAAIVSNNDGGRWLRSNAQLVLTSFEINIQDAMSEAVASYKDGANSSLYLNRAGRGTGVRQ